MNLERYSWPALACLMMATAHAEGSRHSAALSVQADEDGNRQGLSRLALPLGDHAWIQGSIGRTELASVPRDISTVGAAVGIGNQRVDAGVEFVRRTADDQWQQQDWAAALNWHGARGGVGADGFLRSAGSNKESAHSQGFGLHGDLAFTPQAKVFGGVMRYAYDFSASSTTADSHTPLSSLLLGSTTALSSVWRDQAYIDRSYRIGASYRLQSAAVNAQYFRDRAANTGEALNTLQLQAEFLLAQQWLVSPLLGYSSGDSSRRSAYAGLSLGYMW
jgi:hypothetical protein